MADPGRPSPGAGPNDVIRIGPAIATWAVGWIAGMLIVGPIVLLAMDVDGDDYTIPQLAIATALSWVAFLGALAYTSRRYGTSDPLTDFVSHYAVAFKPIDLVGIPLGVVTQLALVPLLYVPLRAIWPSTFSQTELEERAEELADKAGGWMTVLLVLVVVVGAPLVEELVYRGLLQRSMSKVMGGAVGLVLVSGWFALVHPNPVEYPGLFLAGLVFGSCLLVTGRVGGSMLTHAAFNATGLLLALR